MSWYAVLIEVWLWSCLWCNWNIHYCQEICIVWHPNVQLIYHFSKYKSTSCLY